MDTTDILESPLPDGVPDLRPWFIALSSVQCVIDWSEFWGNDKPVELDIGCGRGLFLWNASQANPDINYMGIEVDFKEGRRSSKRLMKAESGNARVLGGDAIMALKKHIPPHSVQAAHVYFPDPWWRKKHRRRRIFTDELVDLCSRVLVPGGHLHSWTDVGDYFEVISALMEHHADFETLPPPPEHSPEHDMDYQTSFERKKRKNGETIYRGLWRKTR